MDAVYSEKVAIARHKIVLEARIRKHGAGFQHLWKHLEILEIVADGMIRDVKKLNRRGPPGAVHEIISPRPHPRVVPPDWAVQPRKTP